MVIGACAMWGNRCGGINATSNCIDKCSCVIVTPTSLGGTGPKTTHRGTHFQSYVAYHWTVHTGFSVHLKCTQVAQPTIAQTVHTGA